MLPVIAVFVVLMVALPGWAQSNYTELDYSRTIPLGDVGFSGTLSELVWHPTEYMPVSAAGHNFQAVAGKTYQITINYQFDYSKCNDVGYFIMTEDLSNFITDYYNNPCLAFTHGCSANNQNGVVVGYFTSHETGTLNILLWERDFSKDDISELDYTVTIKEVDVGVTLYTTLDYSKEITVNGNAVNGTLSEPVIIANFIGYTNVTAEGLNFQAEAGKRYQITVSYNKTDMLAYMAAGYSILKSGTLNSNENDIIDSRINEQFNFVAYASTISGHFESPETGLLRVLLWNCGGNYFDYSVHIVIDDGHDCSLNLSAEKVITKSPTCTQSGSKAYICSICSKEYNTEPVTALGHDLVWKITTTATCENIGTETYACQRLNCTHTDGTRPITAQMCVVMTENEFYERIASYKTATENVVVEIGQSFTLNSLVSIPDPVKADITLTIRSENHDAPIILTRGKSGDLFSVGAATLVLENIIIDGDKDGEGFENGGGGRLVAIWGGTLVMNDGAVIRSNDGGGVSCGATFIMNGGKISGNIGGGVLMSGTFTMNGGEISDNSGGSSGVYMYSGTFTMNGGEISGNTGGGVSINSSGVNGRNPTFIMSGGKISGNIGLTNGDKGAVYVYDGAFTMSGGEISGNTGGGVHINDGTFTLSGGEISGNTVMFSGGGVSMYSGTFTMTGGKISDNTANGNSSYSNNGGGGVHINDGTFTLSGGEISGNTAFYSGGGVNINGGTFTMNGGKISGNTAFYGGGGVGMYSGTFTMSGGEISGNTAGNNIYFNGIKLDGGGGVYIRGDRFTMASGTFTMIGGIVFSIGNINNIVLVNEFFGNTWNLNTSTIGAPNNGIVIAWDRPDGTDQLVYTQGTSTNLAISPTENATALWAIESGKFGISYKNGSNTGFIEIAGVTVTTHPTSILTHDRAVPQLKPETEITINAPADVFTGKFTAGPNPVTRQAGSVTFFRQGKLIQNATLTIFDASGNVVNKIKIKDTKDANDNNTRRIVGSWDLKDAKGRLVGEGTYLVRGVVTASDGKRERVSVMLGIR